MSKWTYARGGWNIVTVHPLRYGYTNHTSGDATVVVKTYQGPDAYSPGRRSDLILLESLVSVAIEAKAPGANDHPERA